MEQEINYAEKINTFKLLIDNNSDDIALNYLQKANWDEEQAAILFNKENRTIPSDVIHQPKQPEPKVTKPTGNTNRNNPYDKFIKIPMIDPSVNQSIFGKLFGWLKAKPENYNKIFDIFKTNVVKDMNDFNKKIRISGRIGIIFLYNKDNLGNLKKICENITKDQLTLKLFTNDKTIFPIVNNSNEGAFIIEKTNIKIFPTILFCKKIPGYPDNFAVLKSIHNNTDKDSLRNAISEVVKLSSQLDEAGKQNNNQPDNKKSNTNFIDDIRNYDPSLLFGGDFNKDIFIPPDVPYNQPSEYKPTNADIIAQQKRDMEELERQENQKRLEEEKRKKKEQEEERLRKEKEEQLKREQENKKKILPPEPSMDDPNKTIIVFRYPDGMKSVTRRFLKTDTINILYIFIETLGKEIYTEDDSTSFELIQTFPFKRYDNREKTLEEEGLYPNSVLQIKEI